MRKVYSILLLLNLFMVTNSYATVNFIAVNHLTKEYYWEEEGSITLGWIGWEYVPESGHDTAEMDLTNLGYKRTDFPFKIEAVLVLAIGILSVGMRRLKKTKAHSKS